MCHHGRGLFQITQNRSLVNAIKTDYKQADIPQKDIAMLDYAVKLTSDPCNVTKRDFLIVRKAGFKDDQILDIVQVAAYFNYVNRLACGLGVDLEDYWEDEEGDDPEHCGDRKAI